MKTISNNFKKVLRLGSHAQYDRRANVYINIKFTDGELSITGVEGPMRNGNAIGACGQIVDHITDVTKYADGWNAKKIKTLQKYWNEWHLNGMNAYCSHQRSLGWKKKAGEKVTLYHWRLKSEVSDNQKAVKEKAKEELLQGLAVKYKPHEIRLLKLTYSITTSEEKAPEEYEPKKSLYNGDSGPTGTKTLGRLRPEEHPEGILGRPCPNCGYKYGSAWNFEEVPEGVLEFLRELPDSDEEPAWV